MARSNKTNTSLKNAIAAIAVVGGSILPFSANAEGPTYADAETKALIDEMVAAHGGADRFFAAPSFKFSIAMYLVTLGISEERNSYNNWRYYTVTVDPDTSRAYIDVPHENLPGPEAGVTAETYWRTAYTFDPPYQEGPNSLAWFHYGMLALPFMTQVDGVELARVENDTLPNSNIDYPVVRMTFSPGGGKSMDGFIDIFIDPDSHLIAGWTQGSAFPLLPGDVLPPNIGASGVQMKRIVDAYYDLDGIITPKSYYTLRPDGNLAGSHIILEASMDEAFDNEMLKMPEGGRVVYKKPE